MNLSRIFVYSKFSGVVISYTCSFLYTILYKDNYILQFSYYLIRELRVFIFWATIFHINEYEYLAKLITKL